MYPGYEVPAVRVSSLQWPGAASRLESDRRKYSKALNGRVRLGLAYHTILAINGKINYCNVCQYSGYLS